MENFEQVTQAKKKSTAWVWVILVIIIILIVGAFLVFRDGGGDNPDPSLPGTPNLDRPIEINGDSDNDRQTRQEIEQLISEIKASEDPSHNQWVSLAAYRHVIGDYEGEKEVWTFLADRSNDFVPWLSLGNLNHYYFKKYSLSEQYYRQAIDLNPSYAPSYAGLHELYALSYVEKADLADDILIEGIEKNPNEVALPYTLAQYYEERGDLENARVYYQKALEIAEKNNDLVAVERIKQILNNL